MKRFLRFRLITLLLAITAFSVGLAVWARSRSLYQAALNHHAAALEAAREAQTAQYEHDPNFAFTSIKRGGFPFKTDADSIRRGANSWLQARYHVRQCDRYLKAARYPWRWVANEPPPQLEPDSFTDREAYVFWSEQVESFLREHEYLTYSTGPYDPQKHAEALRLTTEVERRARLD